MPPKEEEGKPAIRSLVIPMIVPSHKNQLRPARNGGFYLDQKAKKERDALMLYLRAGLTPIGEEWSVRCEMTVDLAEHTTAITLIPLELYDHKKCPDTDGQLTAMFDAAQKCGILHNDNRVRQIWMEVK